MSYPQHPSPAGGAFAASNSGIIRSQNLPYIPSQPPMVPGMGMQPLAHSGFPPQQQHAMHGNPNMQRPIASLPSHTRHMQPPQTPTARPHGSSARLAQQHPGPARTADASSSFKRPKLVGDGFEASYLVPGPSNRILLSLRSGLPVQIDWALSRLVQITANNRDPAARDLTLESVPGLAEVLLSYVRRIHAALTGEPASQWAAPYFEQPVDVVDVGVGAPGDSGHSGTSTLDSSAAAALSTSLIKHHSALISHRLTGTAQAQGESFNPSMHPAHAVLMRRTLEAALALRNFATHSSSVRTLAGVKGIFALIRNVLQLPITAIRTSVNHAALPDTPAPHEDGWLEIEGIAELRLYFLDILESLASKVVLTRRAPSSPSTSAANGIHPTSAQAKPSSTDGSPADDIFTLLLSFALHSKDRAFLLGSLRCLCAMAANERNEAAFVETTLPDGQQSPGLLQRGVELLPVTQDVELLEAVLDLVYQLVCIGNNAIKIASAERFEPLRAHSPSTSAASASNGTTPSLQSLSTRATAKTAALVRFLSRNLQLGRIMWERAMPLRVPQAWLSSIPHRQLETMRRARELQLKLTRETPEESAQRMKLTRRERLALAGLKEPERGIAWMKMVFQRHPDREVTQMDFWRSYKAEFQGNDDGITMVAAGDLIRTVSNVFPLAAAMVVAATETEPQRFVIRGIEAKPRERDQLEPFRCFWSTCPAPDTTTHEAQKKHTKLHAEHSRDGRCRWKNCAFDATKSPGADAVEAQQILMAHVLTHFKSDDSVVAKGSKRLNIVVDDDLRVVSGATHTGEAAQIVTAKSANGARTLRARRDSDGVEISFNLDKAGAGSRAAKANGTGRGDGNPTRSEGTVDNPGLYMFDVTRTPTMGSDESLLPMGPAFTSVLILRMMTRRAASLLQKAGSKETSDEEDGADAAAVRGYGDEKFGLPLPANFGASERGKQLETAEKGEEGDDGAQAGMLGGEEEDYETTARWAVESANRLLDAVEGVEEELMHHASENDILSSYINETLMELRRRPVKSSGDSKGLLSASASLAAQVDPSLSGDDAQ